MTRVSAGRLVALVCIAQVLVQIGAFFWPALMPALMREWALTNKAAGWITSMFYAAYMVSVPVLVTMTDRVDPRRVYLFGASLTVVGHAVMGLFGDGLWTGLLSRALTGIGWAGTYMTGLKLLADVVDARMLSRATTGHAASIGISGAVSYVAADLLSRTGGWPAAFYAAAASAAVAVLIVWVAVPARTPVPPASGHGRLFDFRPVLANRSAMAYALAYCVHTLEMNAWRGWGVAYLGFVAAATGTQTFLWSPTTILALLGLAGTLASVLGNEAAIRIGRQRLIYGAMLSSVVLAGVIAFVGSWSYGATVALVLVYGMIIWSDSSSLTAGTAGTADPARRGATLAIHSMLGYAGGFIGPLAIGLTLDLAGGASPMAWGLAYGVVAAFVAAGLVAFRWLGPRAITGDRAAA